MWVLERAGRQCQRNRRRWRQVRRRSHAGITDAQTLQPQHRAPAAHAQPAEAAVVAALSEREDGRTQRAGCGVGLPLAFIQRLKRAGVTGCRRRGAQRRWKGIVGGSEPDRNRKVATRRRVCGVACRRRGQCVRHGAASPLCLGFAVPLQQTKHVAEFRQFSHVSIHGHEPPGPSDFWPDLALQHILKGCCIAVAHGRGTVRRVFSGIKFPGSGRLSD